LRKKTLYLIRHAKSSWKDPELHDRERPLNKRGHRNAADMPARLHDRIGSPELIISSPAKRALTTAQYFANELDYPAVNIRVDKALYFCGIEGYLRILKNVPKEARKIMLFGHNPDISELLDYLSPSEYEAMPTCAVAKLVIRDHTWRALGPACAEVVFIDAPKRIPQKLP